MSEGPEGVPWEKKHPTLKELFKGTTLNGYIEAARTKSLTEFVEAKKPTVQKVEMRPVWPPTAFETTAVPALEKFEYKRKEYPIEKWYVLYAPHTKPPYYDFEYQILGSWNYVHFERFEDLMNLLSKGKAELLVHATRGKEIVTWKPAMITNFQAKPGDRDETGDAAKGHVWTLIQPELRSEHPLTWVWRVSRWDKGENVHDEIEMWEETWLNTVKRKLPWQTHIQTVLTYITDKTNVEGWASHDEIHRDLELLGLTHEDIDAVVDQLAREGTIYVPREGYYRRT